MIFFLQPSYNPAWRVYLPRWSDEIPGLFEAQQALKSRCRWGGPDKTSTIEGIECWGYEFSSAAEANDALRAAMIAASLIEGDSNERNKG